MNLSSHGIVALVRNDEGKFLLLEDSREQMLGYWAPPHGRCETTDISEEAGIVRETLEETGLAVKPVKKLLTQEADTKVKTVSFWLVELIGGALRIDESETSNYGWFSIDEALQIKLYPGTKIFFEKLKTGELAL
ncbi:MAG TPA: NUDIX hydrolase [Candidatus Saccharimonadales bacterium]